VIGRLRGVLAEVAEEDALIDVGGVGYVVKAGAKTLARLPAVGDELVMHIESVTREDGTRLYGFLTRDERRAFVTLTGVQGVGPKAALAVLDVLPPAELAGAIARDDKARWPARRAWARGSAQRSCSNSRISRSAAAISRACLRRPVRGSGPADRRRRRRRRAHGPGRRRARGPAGGRRRGRPAGRDRGDGGLVKAALQELGR
jgi:Holliday junction DNA helicase RuvA